MILKKKSSEVTSNCGYAEGIRDDAHFALNRGNILLPHLWLACMEKIISRNLKVRKMCIIGLI